MCDGFGRLFGRWGHFGGGLVLVSWMQQKQQTMRAGLGAKSRHHVLTLTPVKNANPAKIKEPEL